VANGKKRHTVFDSDTEDVGHSKKRRVQHKTIKKASRNDNERQEVMNVEADDDEVLLPAVSYLNVQQILLNALSQPKTAGTSKKTRTTRKAAEGPASNVSVPKTRKTTRNAAKTVRSDETSGTPQETSARANTRASARKTTNHAQVGKTLHTPKETQAANTGTKTKKNANRGSGETSSTPGGTGPVAAPKFARKARRTVLTSQPEN